MFNPRRLKYIFSFFLGLMLILMCNGSYGLLAKIENNNQIQSVQSVSDARQAGLIPVGIWMELERIYDISLKDSTFQADGFISINFPKQIAANVKNLGPENPCFTFENDVERSQYSMLKYDQKVRKGERAYEKGYEFSGKFAMGDAWQHRRSPFSDLHLKVIVSPICNFDYSSRKIVLVFDDEGKKLKAANVLAANLEVPIGYNFSNSSLQAQIRKWPGISYSWMVGDVVLRTSAWASFFRWIMPLLVVMAIVIIAPSLGSSYFEARIGIPSASLLTLVFLHDAYRSDLPNFPYLTYLDRLYVYAYIVCLLMFVLFVLDASHGWSNRPMLNINLPFNIKQIISFEQAVQCLCVVGLVLVATISWYV